MGRELRRVPLDFDWPLNKVWAGFLNPHFKKCPAAAKNECHGGYTNGGQWLDAICRFLALLGEQAVSEPHAAQLRARGQIFPHPYLDGFAQAPRTRVPDDAMAKIQELPESRDRQQKLYEYMQRHPSQLLPFTEEIATLIAGLAGGERPTSFAGCMYSWTIRKTILKAAGIDPDGNFGTCPVCGGQGIDPASLKAYEEWVEEPPPSGDGWQLWETVSEGSPISKVYATRESFAAYLVGEGYSEKAAEAFCESGWAPSAIMVDGKLYKDIESSELAK